MLNWHSSCIFMFKIVECLKYNCMEEARTHLSQMSEAGGLEFKSYVRTYTVCKERLTKTVKEHKYMYLFLKI